MHYRFHLPILFRISICYLMAHALCYHLSYYERCKRFAPVPLIYFDWIAFNACACNERQLKLLLPSSSFCIFRLLFSIFACCLSPTLVSWVLKIENAFTCRHTRLSNNKPANRQFYKSCLLIQLNWHLNINQDFCIVHHFTMGSMRLIAVCPAMLNGLWKRGVFTIKWK